MESETPQGPTIYQQVGGMHTFERLAEAFYEQVQVDPILRPLFVEESFEGPKQRLGLFLAQFFGGPGTYSEQRGHPRLRARHLPFPIGVEERNAWVGHMLLAIDEVEIQEPARSEMRDYFQRAATFLINKLPE